MKVHLVDGTFELFRCFFGAPQVTNAAGEEVGACRALLNTLVSLLRQSDVTHVAVAFDQVVDVTRRGKTLPITGPGTDPKLRSQFPLAADLVRALGLVMWPMIRYQADDALHPLPATASRSTTCSHSAPAWANSTAASTGSAS